MKTEFTKGKWIIEEQSNSQKSRVIYTYEYPLGILNVYGGQHSEANAKLIAASPELLNACINSAKTLIAIGVTMEADIMVELENAIKKATT